MKDNGFKASNANIPKGITKLLPWLELFWINEINNTSIIVFSDHWLH